MSQSSNEMRTYLQLCKRLGIRYLSPPAPKTLTAQGAVVEVAAPEGPKPVVERGMNPSDSVVPPWLTSPLEGARAVELAAFDQEICECQKCPLGKTRKHFVFGSGSAGAEVMFVGEAPGADEDAQGLPFVGRAGQLLTKIIESTKTWKRGDVFICNVLKCRPPGNRTPLPEEVEACRSYLEEQIRILQPKLIMALGAVAAQALLRTKDSVGKLRSRWHDFRGVPLRVTYHPAALLRFDGYKKDVWEDMKEFTQRYKEIHQESEENNPPKPL